MTRSPVTPARSERPSPPACPGAPIRTPSTRGSNLDGHGAVTPYTPTPSTNNGAPILSSSPITPADELGNNVAELEDKTTQLSVVDGSDTSKEVVAVNGGVNGESSSGVHELQTTSANHVEAEATAAQHGPSGILTTSNANGGARRNGDWREREVSFALPAEGADDPFSQNGSGNNSVTETNGPSVSYVRTETVASAFRPRGDREIVGLSGANAQALLPPDSCVFVANLTAQLADDQLEYKVKEKFEQFGNCYVKIKRDPRGMPYAFVQFENIKDAERAIIQGRGMMIEGRQCRTERAKVQRALFLSRSTGGPITAKEARSILHGFGDLEKIWVASDTDKEMFRLPDGIWVQFAFFQDCRDAQMMFKENPSFRLEQPPPPEELRGRVGRASLARMSAPRSGGRSFVTGPRKTIFVGNLPSDVPQAELRAKFTRFGSIDAMEIVVRHSLFGGVGLPTNFAFITYHHEADARSAVNSIEPVFLRDRRLRVELREGRNLPRTSQVTPATTGSPIGHQGYAVGASSNAGMQIIGSNGQGTSTASTAGVGPGVYQVPYVHPYYTTQYGMYMAQPLATNYGYASSATYGTSMSQTHRDMVQAQYAPAAFMGQYGNGYVVNTPYYPGTVVDANGNVVSELSDNSPNTN